MSLFEEKSDDECPPVAVQIIEEVTGPPAFTVYVKRISPRRLDELQELRNDTPRPGFRQDAATKAKNKQKFIKAFCEEVLEPRWDNATEGNLVALLDRAKSKLGESALKLIRDNGGEMPFSVEVASALMKVAWGEDFDAEVWGAARYGVGQAVKTKGEDKSSFGAPA